MTDRAGDAKRILVVRLGAIGDALRVLPAVRRLRRERPAVTIAWAVEQWVYPVLAGNPSVDRFHVLDRRALRGGARSAARECRRFVREIRAGGYDTVLDFHGRLKSGVVSACSGAATRIGYARGDCTEGNHLFNNVHVKLADRWENRVLRFLHLLEPLGVVPHFDPGDTGVYVEPEVVERARAWYRQVGAPRLAAYPGNSRLRTYLRWPQEKWVELLQLLHREGVDTVVFWGPDDADYARAITAGAAGSCTLAPATTLREMMAMIACFDAFIGANTAATHMAWLQGVPTALFVGPVHPQTDSPLPSVPSRLLWAGEHFREGLRKRDQVEVVTAVTVESALQAVRELLRNSDTGRATAGGD